MIQEALLKIIICPKCQSDLEYNKEEYNLKCTNCEEIYRIENDIPIMIIEEKKNDG
ncbi:MAG: Trm112 family protein [Bacteroidetes bacterium]|nr:Trm112 family protein [Bacteroidota bacterium]MBU1422399.1 Trm112 family protein [Bacteroidota bacterium]MBU2471838.1 Trm112 family protein [Bacteroidota bacterium]MBU2636699.1 Trm112 family protein [Bacteroidota bacterium]